MKKTPLGTIFINAAQPISDYRTAAFFHPCKDA